MEKHQIGKHWRFLKKNNVVYLIDLITSKQYKITEDTSAVLVLLNQLAKGVLVKDLERAIQKQFPNLEKSWLSKSIQSLQEREILKRNRISPQHFSKEYLDGLDRQLDFLEGTFPQDGMYKKQLALKNARVAILGLGTIAQYIIPALVASGFTNFVCVDFDTVENRNVGRQPLLRQEDVGTSKVKAISRYLKKTCSEARVKTHNLMLKGVEDVKFVIRDCDLVVHCCDYPRFSIHRWINRACLDLSKPNLLAYSGRIGPLSIPFKTACYGCLETFYRENLIAYDELAKQINQEGMGRYPELAVVGSMTGSIAAKEIVAFFLKMETETRNAFFDIDPTSLNINKFALNRNKDCYACKRSG